MTTPQKRNAGWLAGAPITQSTGRGLQADCSAPLDLLLSRLEGVQIAGKGYRAMCPSCGGKSRKVSIAEADNGSVLLHAFCGCTPAEVLAGAGLALADLFPVRLTPQTPEERRAARRAMQEASWRAALVVVDTEIAVVQAAARMVARWQCLSQEDDARLQLAAERVASARGVLNERV